MTNHDIIQFITAHGLFSADLSHYRISEMKAGGGLYGASLQKKAAALFGIWRNENTRSKELIMYAADTQAFPDFPGTCETIDGHAIARCPLTPEAAQFLRREFPFTAPQALKGKDATIGTGDRLGLANPAHIQAVREHDIFPVLAQQSMRELDFTGRTYQDVLDAATFAVFQEGYEDGFGFDGDHLKRIEDIEMALACGATMITLDLSDVMNTAAADWNTAQLDEHFRQLPDQERDRLTGTYLKTAFDVSEDVRLTFTNTELQRCCAMYSQVVEFAIEVYQLLVARKGVGNVDFEVSIDETTTPTLPEHHLFIVKELIDRDVVVDSLAPRFVGEFQKAIDYIGDLSEFERQLKIHCDIARAYGNYKVSIHSGSDKFSVYPAIGTWTKGRLHVKTAGTSWLEAVRVIAAREPELYRKIHQKALDSYPEALKFYHITADFGKVPSLDNVSDDALPQYLDHPEARQLLHIIYGFVMQDADLRKAVYDALFVYEDLHYAFVRKHINKHVRLLGRPTKDGKRLMRLRDYAAQYGELRKPWAETIADSVLATYPNPNDLHDYHPGRWVYQNGIFINALFQLWQKTERPEYFQYIVDWVDIFIDENGVFDPRKYNPEVYTLDNILPGRILISLYQETGREKYKIAAQALIQQLQNQPKTSEGGYWHKQVYPYQMWLDGIYMADLFSSEFARALDEPQWFDEAVHQITLIYAKTLDPATGLLYHGWDETKTQIWAHPERGTSPEFWGRALGWYTVALVEALEVLPDHHDGCQAVLTILNNLAVSLVKCQHPDTGMWYQVLDKRDRPDNWPETSCTTMFAYAFAKAARKGYVTPEYRAYADKAYQYMLNECLYLDQHGDFYLTGIVTVGSLRDNADYDYYVTSPQRTNDFKGVGAFLYLCLEMEFE